MMMQINYTKKEVRGGKATVKINTKTDKEPTQKKVLTSACYTCIPVLLWAPKGVPDLLEPYSV